MYLKQKNPTEMLLHHRRNQLCHWNKNNIYFCNYNGILINQIYNCKMSTFINRSILFFVFLTLYLRVEVVRSYLIVVHEETTPGAIIFNASVYKLGSERFYKINTHKSAHFVHHLVAVNHRNGEIELRKSLRCDGIYYPNLFTFYIDSTTNRLHSIDYYSLPIRIFVSGHNCNEDRQLEQQLYYNDNEQHRQSDNDNQYYNNDSNILHYTIHSSNSKSKRKDSSKNKKNIHISDNDEHTKRLQYNTSHHQYRQRRSLMSLPKLKSLTGNFLLPDVEQDLTGLSDEQQQQEKQHNHTHEFQAGDILFGNIFENEMRRRILSRKRRAGDQQYKETYYSYQSPSNTNHNHNHYNNYHYHYDYPLNVSYNADKSQTSQATITSFLLTSLTSHRKISEAKQWISETYASYAIHTTDKWQRICLRKSQFVNNLNAFIPLTICQYCKVNFFDVNDERFIIERHNRDLVASRDVCIHESIWKINIMFNIRCNRKDIIDSDHRLKIVYHHQEFNDTDIAKRVKRELRNQSPYFEQALYVASVLEEQPAGSTVTTVRARDPEDSPVVYSMVSLLDSRSQSLFKVDSRTGLVATASSLDRELMDVHYFRVVATDDSFPPRSGTTTLQVNVLDCNDHNPSFEAEQFEASIRETATVGSTVITLRATDQDIGKNAEIEYSIENIMGEFNRLIL